MLKHPLTFFYAPLNFKFLEITLLTDDLAEFEFDEFLNF